MRCETVSELGCCLSSNLFNLYSETIIRECFDGKRDTNLAVECMRFPDGTVVVASGKILTENVKNE